MAVDKIAANGWTFEVDTDPDGIPNTTYAAIAGIEDFDVSRSKTEVDVTDIDSGGEDDSVVIRRGRTLTLNGFRMEDSADGSRDAGQAQVETSDGRTGAASKTYYRITSPGGTMYTFLATTTVQPYKGGKNGMTMWSVTLKVAGSWTVV